MTEVEKLRKELSALELKKVERERKHAEASQRKVELDSRRQTLLAQIADGDEDARHDLRRLDAERQEAGENVEAFAAGAASAAAQWATTKQGLARAERDAAISTLESQIASLGSLNNNVEMALATLKQESAALFSAVNGVAEQLRSIDADRFDSAFGHKLGSLIRESIYHRFEEMQINSVEKRPTFLQRAEPQLRAAIAQLRYESLQGHVIPTRGEQLYRTLCRITGIRNLDLGPHSLIALRANEAAEFLANGSLELVEHSGSDEQAA